MKATSLFGLFTTLFVAAFVLVGCESDPAVPAKTGISFETSEALSCMGGSGEIAYEIHTPIEGAELVLSASSEPWLYNLSVDEQRQMISFYYDRYAAEFGAPDRQTTFRVSYGDSEPYVITLTQAGPREVFEVTFLEITPNSAYVAVAPESEEIAYLVGKTTEEEIQQAGSLDRIVLELANGYVDSFYGDILDKVLLMGTYPASEDQEPISCKWDELTSTPYFYVAGIGRNARNEAILSTPVHAYPVELPETPVLTLEQSHFSVGIEAGELNIPYTLQNPLDGKEITLEVAPSGSWITSAEVLDGQIKILYTRNRAAIARVENIAVNYPYAEPAVITIEQAPDLDQEPISFELEVLESHFNRVLVNLTPSDPTVKYVLNGISKSEYEGYPHYGSDEALWQGELSSSFYTAPVYTGEKENFSVAISPSDYYGWDWYIYAYAISDDETMAISEVEKVLITVVNDTPKLSFVNTSIEVLAEGGIVEAPYILQNPIEGGYLTVDGALMDYYEMIDDPTVEIDEQKSVLRFRVNPYDPEQKYHDATIFIAYFENPSSTTSICGASLKIHQKAPAN